MNGIFPFSSSSEQYSTASFPTPAEKCMISGVVSTVEKGCAVQYSCRGLILEEDMTEVEEEEHYGVIDGENACYDVYCLENLEFTLPSPPHRYQEITLYVDVEKVKSVDIIQQCKFNRIIYT